MTPKEAPVAGLVRARLFRDAADVGRWHTKRTLRQQSLGQHSFNMLTLLLQVLPEARKELMVAVIHHDLPELFTGDLPATIKWLVPELDELLTNIESNLDPLYHDGNLAPFEVALLKWCDSMELVLWCLEEVEMGNTYCRKTVGIVLNRIPSYGFINARASQLFQQVLDHAASLAIFPIVPEGVNT